MADEIKVNSEVTPSLHPGVVKALDGYDDATAPYLAPVVNAFETAYSGLKDLWNAREQAQANTAWTEAQRVLQLAKFGETHQDKITRKFDSVHKSLRDSIKGMEEMLTTPLKHAAERPGIASEIRAHFKGLSVDERYKVLADAQKRGDIEVLQSVLGAPAMLSGMTENERALRTRIYHETKTPDVAKRLKAMRNAAELIEARSPLLFAQVTKAIGADWPKIKRLRAAQTTAEQAFIVREHGGTP